MFNTSKDDFYTLIINGEPTSFMFTSLDEAIEHIKQDGSWDCRPHAGSIYEWYDAASGWIYKIQQCDDCGRY